MRDGLLLRTFGTLADEDGGCVPPWDPDGDVLVCRQVWDETPDVRTFLFGTREPRRFAFAPGQFVTFLLPVGAEPVPRSYTIASSPTRPFTVAVTVKRKPGGAVSNWMHDNVRPSVELRATGPSGQFSFLRHASPKYLFLSAGSGITPIMSMARMLCDLGSDADVVLVNSARTPDDLLFREELDLIARCLPRFRVVHVCGRDSARGAWTGYRGRLRAEQLRIACPDFAEREVFACGPEGYLETARGILDVAGRGRARYHEELFTFDGQPDEAAETGGDGIRPAEDAGVARFKVLFSRSGLSVECAADTTVLAAAQAAGLRAPASCRSGMCGTCKKQMTSGQVDMRHAGGIRPREIAEGRILLCCSKPLSDLVIDL